MTTVKICGITNLDDALHAANTGADMLGFNFYSLSPRFIEPAAAADIIRSMSAETRNVGVFVNESIDRICETVQMAGIDAVQLHGDESVDFVKDLSSRLAGVEIIKALRIGNGFDAQAANEFNVSAILLDAYSGAGYGGTGHVFDWEMARQVQSTFVGNVFLAGGLSHDNVASAISAVRPYAVDACSLLEIEPGRKDHVKVEKFISAVKTTI